MTPKTFWTIFLKIIGIWFVLDSFMIVYQFFTYLLIINKADSLMMALTTLGLLVLTISFYFLVLYFCIFKTNWIIDKLKLDKGFIEEKFEIKLHHSTILTIAFIVIGGLLIIDSFPQLCRQVIQYLYQDILVGRSSNNPAWSLIILHIIKTFIGFYLMTNSRFIINFIELQRRKSNQSDNEQNQIK